jgi:hypothetical protein
MAKYPTPEVARKNFEEGVEESKDLWVKRAKAGATAYQTWYVGFANELYPLIAALPTREGKTRDERVDERVKPVVNKIAELSASYRAAKLAEIAKKVAPLVRAR